MAVATDINWSAVAAVCGIVGVIEAPLIVISGSMWRWARKVDTRLTRIEARSHERRADDDEGDQALA